MKLLPPLILGALGLAVGLAGGALLRPAAESPAAAAPAGPDSPAAEAPADAADPLASLPPADPADEREYVRLESQFIVPVMAEARVGALIVLSISLEIDPGLSNEVYAREPKLRDAFLRVLFAHERAGGFTGAFTDSRVMDELRGKLRAAAAHVLGPMLHDVLVTDILRQDV
jgi:hypothetical protein